MTKKECIEKHVNGKWRYTVITNIDPIDEWEDDLTPNMADCNLYEVAGVTVAETRKVVYADRLCPVKSGEAKHPIFTLGEIMIVDANGIEAPGFWRKPWKFNVEYETFDTLPEAIRRQAEVVDIWWKEADDEEE